jgi:hypothetical protein
MRRLPRDLAQAFEYIDELRACGGPIGVSEGRCVQDQMGYSKETALTVLTLRNRTADLPPRKAAGVVEAVAAARNPPE